MLPSIPNYLLTPPLTQANKTQWTPQADQALLLVHDMQEHFVQAFEDKHQQLGQAISKIQALTTQARQAGVPIVYTAQPPAQSPQDRQLLTDFWGRGLQDQAASRIIDPLTPQPQDRVLTKWRYCAFYRSPLEEIMRDQGKTQLWISGIYSHIGCQTTALTAFMKGFQVFFIGDAQADFSAQEHQQALNYVGSRCGQVISSQEALAALTPETAEVL